MEFIVGIIIIISIVLITRLFGAWMLRIDEVIKLLREIRDNLKK
tara:strand:- start:159 stop:290 length:132 start_codon:yes stop_codon:yes gene_type:complete